MSIVMHMFMDILIFCCGIGFGAIWVDYHKGKQIDLLCQKLTQQARQLGAYKYGQSDD